MTVVLRKLTMRQVSAVLVAPRRFRMTVEVMGKLDPRPDKAWLDAFKAVCPPDTKIGPDTVRFTCDYFDRKGGLRKVLSAITKVNRRQK